MVGVKELKIAVTGCGGLLGWHTAGRIHAGICASNFRNETAVNELVCINKKTFNTPVKLIESLNGVDTIIHYAGVNRAADEILIAENFAITKQLVDAINSLGVDPHIIFANSTHSLVDTPYGNVKRKVAETLKNSVSQFSDVLLPHVFGERAKPYYNNVTATLIDKLWLGEDPDINAGGKVQLVHAGEVAMQMIGIANSGESVSRTLPSREISVTELYTSLCGMHGSYVSNIIPVFEDEFEKNLFNCLRSGMLDHQLPIALKMNSDDRGSLFETAKGGRQSQTFLSTTFPGVTRGDHFHLNKIERFVVVSGEAVIRMRKVLGKEVLEYRVSGEKPTAIDMPPLYTHSIENVGSETLVTQFWVDEIFDPENPDTYADRVLQ